uniref:Uncharacterized protein n=1 Tax=Arundo donax TaxID=35708 RepID=A0A0A9EL99_ARUDO
MHLTQISVSFLEACMRYYSSVEHIVPLILFKTWSMLIFKYQHFSLTNR